MRLFQNANYQFLQMRRKAYMLSSAVIALLIAGALYMQFSAGGWLNYGVDFTGGTLVQVTIEGETETGDVRNAVQSAVEGAEVTEFGDAGAFLIRAPSADEGGTPISEVVVGALNEAYGPGQVRVDRVETVGPKIGDELQGRAALAVLLSFLATLIYLGFRFEWRFGVAALIATVHDVIITLLLISVLRLEVSLPTVAAVLTIIGYSLNDTIVIFDRIRENRKLLGRRVEAVELINRAVNETLGRTVITGGSTLLALLSLFFLGGEVIREFALILTLGIVIGTYSSIMIGAAALYDIEQRAGESHKFEGSGGHAKRRAGAAV